MTDNKNRTVSGVRNAFSKSGRNLGTDGSVSYLFDKCGVISYSEAIDENTVMDTVLEAGADDVFTHDNGLIDNLEDHYDFQEVYHNAEISDDVMESLE